MIGRRGFLIGLGSLLVAAPAIVRAASLMPVRGIVMPVEPVADVWAIAETSRALEREIFDYAFEDHSCMGVYEPYPTHPEAARLVRGIRPRDMEKFRREMAAL